ncbi:TetR/AcrR family transcriptional regulator [Paenibacillus polymyxa]|uniref:TetR/AcrR family transcriptional regulator n=1 Tax=Paenibacillus TaxID=44249 RepID=UPI0002FB2DCF|nr:MULTISPECIES: TetR/AcrR family transcriptional regulator [Paenibacillus]MEB4783339.1 TetR/AcrR family transcriptional regulator [Paenibacillus jamilae]KAF6655202.1 TetR/AcrR family transcriptional regulator [Paenibacillus sp. EKM301P]NMP11638.1 TetR/AcrR family transcriptional regulator [Paenibacillus polymyxa]QDA29217.1 TetR/AcrR family transcriptional regulator [Paenibacillus polymyxa]RPE03937.1 TetR/AcrR family transcriptional regulator [Paenibacillus polymyxa]
MIKVDRRILKTQEALKKAVIELMAVKNFDDITIQDIANKANVNRGTIYLHYQDKYDLLDQIMETHINELKEMDTWACQMEWADALVPYFEYFEKNYLLFSTMLAGSKGTPSSFRTRLLAYFMEGFKGEIDKESGKNAELTEDVMLQYAGTAYVGVIEWWIRNGMPYSPQVMATQVGTLLERSF